MSDLLLKNFPTRNVFFRMSFPAMKLCPLCSHPCVPIESDKPKKRSFLGLWGKTVKLPFLHGSRKKETE